MQRRSFGGMDRTNEACGDPRGGGWAENLWHDFGFCWRMLRKNPSFTQISVIALAFGIGANPVIFSAFDAIMLRPLPYADPERIVTLWDSFPELGVKKIGFTYANFIDLKQCTHVFEPLALYSTGSSITFNLTGLAGPERIQGTRITANFFQVLGVVRLVGRTLNIEDEDYI